MQHLVSEAGLRDKIEIDSAGTSAYHIGESPDRRSAGAAARHGVQLVGHARQFVVGDFERFDYVIAMDRQNLQALEAIATAQRHHERLTLMRDYEPGADGPRDVPDPYYGGGDGFERVFQICRRSCTALLATIRAEHHC